MAQSGIGWFIVISLTATLGYFLGLLTFLTDFEKNGCDMTYMYEYPQFVRISVKEDIVYEKYSLYAYSEGQFIKYVRSMQFSGTPVLFIPGNAGSYRQVRSFASVALRKSLKSRHMVHFDFFTVDLNDELSGLNGALLTDQMNYVNHSISKIMDLYRKSGHRRTSLIVLAHSMGGIIARGLLTSLPKNSVLLPVIITLATPHLRPPAALDSYMADFYDNIERNSINKNSTVVALSGGFNDFLVPPFYTNTKERNFMHVTTTSVPLVWLPVDHLCILWCKQLVLAVTRSIFALVDHNSHHIILNSTYHHSVFNHYLVQHNGIKLHKLANYQIPINFTTDDHDKWIEILQGYYTANLLHGTKNVEWHMIRLSEHLDREHLTVLAINLEVTDWIFACTATHVQNEQRICSTGMHLSHLSEIVPSIHNKRRRFTINIQDLRNKFTNISHVGVRVYPTRAPIILHMDVYDEHDRTVDVKLPNWWNLGRQVILRRTAEKVIHYELLLRQLKHIVQSFKLYIEPIKCTNHGHHHAVASLNIPWAHQNVHRYISNQEKKPLDIRLFSSRPHGLNESFPSVLLTLDPTCTYSISVQISILGMLGNMARTYTPLLFANVAAVVLLSFRKQLICIDQTKSCSVFFTALKTGVKPYYILTMVKVSSRFLSWKGFTEILPIPDWQLISEEYNDFFWLPLLLYLCSVGIVWLSSLCLLSSMFVCEASLNKMALKILSHSVRRTFQFSNWIIRCLYKLPGVVAIILIVLSFTACGGVALLFGCIFYYMKLIQMSQEYVEGVVIKYMKFYARRFFKQNTELDDTESQESSRVNRPENSETNEIKYCCEQPVAYSALFFHFSIMLLWSLLAGIHIPHVLTWARNFRFSTELKPDPSFLPGLILSICAIPLWQLDLPKVNKSGYMVLSEILNLIAAAALIYAPLSLYRLVYLLTGAIVLVTLHQMFAPDCTDEVVQEEDESEDKPDLDSEINKMKTKLE